MQFSTPDELFAHYAAVKQRIAAAAQAATAPIPFEPQPIPPPPEPEPEPEPDLRPPLLAGAPIGRARELLEPVLQRHMVTWKQVAGKDRHNVIVAARQECMWVLNKAGMSLPMIGRFMKRDHTTVLHGVQQHERKRSS